MPLDADFPAVKRPLEQCESMNEIFHHYWLEEMRDWCKAHKLSSSGTKKQLIRRILEWNEANANVNVKKRPGDDNDSIPLGPRPTKPRSTPSTPKKPAGEKVERERDTPDTDTR